MPLLQCWVGSGFLSMSPAYSVFPSTHLLLLRLWGCFCLSHIDLEECLVNNKEIAFYLLRHAASCVFIRHLTSSLSVSRSLLSQKLKFYLFICGCVCTHIRRWGIYTYIERDKRSILSVPQVTHLLFFETESLIGLGLTK